MAESVPAAPLISQLEPCEPPDGGELDELVLSEALVERHGRDALTARRIHVQESELRGVTLGEGVATDLLLSDARLNGCDLSNVRARRGSIRRVEVADSRLVGFSLSEGKVEDVRVAGGTMMLCSFAHSHLRRVAFENVNLREASFLETQLTSVSFTGCDLTGADFRGARLKDCAIRGSSLDCVVGVESLRGLTMPWGDLVGSVAALAAALGIGVEGE
jgi:uncharacterized protein YjbI with pentapeptide repeats